MRPTALQLAASLLLFSGCGAHGNYPTYHTHLNVSANMILGEAMGEVRGWTKDDRVAVVNLDSVMAEDELTPRIVQDALIYGINRLGITVVERDSDAVRWLAQEGSGERISYGVTSYSKDAGVQMTTDAELMGARRYVPGSRYLVDGETYLEVPEGTDLLDLGPEAGDDVLTRIDLPPAPLLVNDVLTATKILGFRIVDVSIRDDAYDEIIQRHANIVLQLRLIDAQYGTVIWSGLVEDSVSDEIPSVFAGKLRRAKPDSPKPSAHKAHSRDGEHLWDRPIRVVYKIFEKEEEKEEESKGRKARKENKE